MDELIKKLQSVGIGCYVMLCYTLDMTHLLTDLFSLMITSKYMLNGSRLTWSNCVKHLGNYVKYDWSEYEEIWHKKADVIWRVNGLCIKYQDTVLEVKMHLLNAYCCHFYGVQAWSFNYKNIKYIITAWNKTVRKIWNLPCDSHRILICALNNGSNALDFNYRRFCGMYNCMTNSENTKLSMLIKMCKNDKRMILFRNLRCVCKTWGVSELQLWSKFKSKTYLF